MTPDSHHQKLRRPVSIKEVAAEAGVSATTVSHVLSGKRRVNEETAARVRRVVNRVGFVPASFARNLQAGSTGVIGLLVPDIDNAFFATVAKGVEDTANSLGYSVILGSTAFNPDREDKYLDMIRSRFIDAIVYAAGSHPSKARLESLHTHFPVMLIDEELEGLDQFPLFTADHYGGGRLLGVHLKELGHHSALVLSGPNGLKSSSDRVRGFRDAFSGEIEEMTGDFQQNSGFALMSAALRRGTPAFTAVFAANDLMAVGVLRALRDAGIAVPGDMSVAGFDDIRMADFLNPSLTTIRISAYQLATRATQHLLKHVLSGELPPPVRKILPVELMARESTGAVKK